jgi:uncharacterized protein YndB with AHSA1/START domain
VIRGLVRLALAGPALAWSVEVLLRSRASAGLPRPFRSLIVVDAPIGRVWAALADIEAQPRWMRDMKSVRLIDPPPVRVGTRAVATVRVFGLAVRDPVTVTAFEPPVRFAIRHEGTFGGEGMMSLEAGADGTTTIVRWDEMLIAPLLPFTWRAAATPVFGRIFQADLARLAALIEADGARDRPVAA